MAKTKKSSAKKPATKTLTKAAMKRTKGGAALEEASASGKHFPKST